MAQQGTVLSAGRAQGIILGDDGVRYTYAAAGLRPRWFRGDESGI